MVFQIIVLSTKSFFEKKKAFDNILKTIPLFFPPKKGKTISKITEIWHFSFYQNSFGNRKLILNNLYLVRRFRPIPGKLSEMVLQISQNCIKKNCKKKYLLHILPPKKMSRCFFLGGGRREYKVNQ